MAGVCETGAGAAALGTWRRRLDIVVECAPAALLRDIAEPALAAGRTLVTLSCGALLDNFDLVELARRHGGRILVPTGALLGLDAVQAAARRRDRSVQMITRKPPERARRRAISGRARHLRSSGIWTPRNACLPAARARRRAAFRPMSTSRRRWRWPGSAPTARRSRSGPIPRSTATPTASRSRRIRCGFSMQIENVPSVENPSTGRLTPLSVVALLRKLSARWRSAPEPPFWLGWRPRSPSRRIARTNLPGVQQLAKKQ